MEKMKVIIVGMSHEEELARKVIEANQEMGCEVLLLDDKPFPVSTVKALELSNSTLHRDPLRFFPKKGSKYHK